MPQPSPGPTACQESAERSDLLSLYTEWERRLVDRERAAAAEAERLRRLRESVETSNKEVRLYNTPQAIPLVSLLTKLLWCTPPFCHRPQLEHRHAQLLAAERDVASRETEHTATVSAAEARLRRDRAKLEASIAAVDRRVDALDKRAKVVAADEAAIAARLAAAREQEEALAMQVGQLKSREASLSAREEALERDTRALASQRRDVTAARQDADERSANAARAAARSEATRKELTAMADRVAKREHAVKLAGTQLELQREAVTAAQRDLEAMAASIRSVIVTLSKYSGLSREAIAKIVDAEAAGGGGEAQPRNGTFVNVGGGVGGGAGASAGADAGPQGTNSEVGGSSSDSDSEDNDGADGGANATMARHRQRSSVTLRAAASAAALFDDVTAEGAESTTTTTTSDQTTTVSLQHVVTLRLQLERLVRSVVTHVIADAAATRESQELLAEARRANEAEAQRLAHEASVAESRATALAAREAELQQAALDMAEQQVSTLDQARRRAEELTVDAEQRVAAIGAGEAAATAQLAELAYRRETLDKEQTDLTALRQRLTQEQDELAQQQAKTRCAERARPAC